MTKQSYVPERGDIVYMELSPQAGTEQAGRRPALVLSRQDFNDKTGYAIVTPITSKAKAWPFAFELPDGLPVSGVALMDQTKSLDWRARYARRKGACPIEVVDLIAETVSAVILPTE